MEPKARRQRFDMERLIQVAGRGAVDGAKRQPRQVRKLRVVDPWARS